MVESWEYQGRRHIGILMGSWYVVGNTNNHVLSWEMSINAVVSVSVTCSTN